MFEPTFNEHHRSYLRTVYEQSRE